MDSEEIRVRAERLRAIIYKAEALIKRKASEMAFTDAQKAARAEALRLCDVAKKNISACLAILKKMEGLESD